MRPSEALSSSAVLNDVSWHCADGLRFFTGISVNHIPLPVFGTKGLLAAIVRRERDPEYPVELAAARPSAEFRDLHLRLEHIAPAETDPPGLLRARLEISQCGSSPVNIVANFAPDSAPYRAAGKRP